MALSGPAVKKLFYAFAVTQEDFVHPMAVVELLWRSCCASEGGEQEGSMTARLKVRQRAQMLVDHSLLLNSLSIAKLFLVHILVLVLTFTLILIPNPFADVHWIIRKGDGSCRAFKKSSVSIVKVKE